MSTNLVRESEIEAYLVKQVCKAGGVSYKFKSPGRNGVPDRIIVHNGEVFFIEVKAPGEEPTKLQYNELKRLLKFGATAGWVSTKHDVDLFVASYCA